MRKKIFISDLDKTLARSDKTIGERTREGLLRLYDKKVLFTIATARSMNSIRPILGDIKFHLPIIEYNGGLISDFNTGKNIKINSLKSESVSKIWDLAKSIEFEAIISTIAPNNFVYYPANRSEGMDLFIENRRDDPRLRESTGFCNIIKKEILSMTFIDNHDRIKELYDLIRPKFPDVIMYRYANEYATQWWWITIHSKESSKGNAITQLINLYSLTDYEIYVFGDNINDSSMFEVADVRIAVENAHDELKAKADIIIANNDCDSVIEYILKEL